MTLVLSRVDTVDPATGARIASYPAHTWEEISGFLDEARGVFVALPRRIELLRAIGRLLTERRGEYAALVTAEMGKPVTEALAEIDKCALNCAVVADHAGGWLADVHIGRSWVSYEPLGVVFAVMPWNFPFWQVLRFACAAVAAGNAAVLKHAPNVTGCALAIERLFLDAGAPAGLFRAIVVAEADVPAVTARVISDRRVAAVTITGSERAGAAVASLAGAAVKKSVLELGGSDPFVVLADADLSAAVDAAVRSRFGNCGQSCVAAKRFIVVEPVADAFVRLLTERVAALTLGPMARVDLCAALHRQVVRTVAEGALLVTGGCMADRPGYFYEPTILDHVRPGMTAFREETFGPVAAVTRARDDEHAVVLANDTEYGLGAAVWGSPGHALDVGRRIRSGALFVNAVVASDPRLPFGGIGRSGYGRELAAEGVREFTNIRTVVVG